MQQQITLQVLPSEAANDAILKKLASNATGKKESSITGFQTLKKSIDARTKNIKINLSLNVFIDEPFHARPTVFFQFRDISKAPKKVVIIGAGPAGLFAALRLIEKGIKPIILERGKDVRARRRDLAVLNKEGVVNTESNYCFGEGGAGTYSDGKLYTRSNKRGDINRILHLFVQFGADAQITYEAHPHIGTNKLPQIITAMRQQITDCGGEFLFEKKVTDFVIEKDKLKKVITQDGNSFEADAFILATGHSARDIFTLLHYKHILIEPKPFALGVRIEHPQELINNIQYHCSVNEFLPPASYNLVQQVEDKGVFSFCMCPGGIIAPAATAPGELVVNGWSPSKRNNPFANSGMVVQVELKDIISKQGTRNKEQEGPLALMHFQQSVEQAAFTSGGGNFVAPAQRMVDFTQGKRSASLPDCSYLPGLNSVQLNEVLPDFVNHSLVRAFKAFGKKMHGYYTNDAVVVATESRTSSPVRIPRNPETLAHPQLANLYPCGEGAGYAGGIISAAMDGERVVDQLVINNTN
jgi:uncharacterized FAD-dependent dehydrogenase